MKLTLVGETVGPGVTGPQFGLVAVDAQEMALHFAGSRILA